MAGHGEVEQLLGVDQVVVAVGAEVDADPVDRAGEGVVASRVVVSHWRTGVGADPAGLESE